MFGLGKKRLVGIDIGTASIKLVELSDSKGHLHLETYGIAQLGYGSPAANDFSSPLDVTIHTLKDLLKKTRVHTNRVVASLPTSTVFVSVFEVDKATPEVQKDLIEKKAAQVVPLPLDDMTVSWSTVPSLDQASAKDSILLTAVPNHVIANYVSIFEALKLQPEAIEVEAMALVRAMIGQDQSTVLIIDMGSKSSTLNLVDNGYIYFTRSLPTGGEALTRSIAQTLGVDLERAEQFKKSIGLGNLDSADQEIPRSLKPIFSMFRKEVEQMINLIQAKGKGIDKIILTGGGAKWPGLDQFFSVYKIPITLGNPWARIIVPEPVQSLAHDLGPDLSVAIGLAMRQE